MIIRDDGDLERLQADGKISPADADEVRNFGDFLRATAGVPTTGRTPEQARRFREAYAEHYPEDYARAVAEQAARAEQVATGDANSPPSGTEGHARGC